MHRPVDGGSPVDVELAFRLAGVVAEIGVLDYVLRYGRSLVGNVGIGTPDDESPAQIEIVAVD